MICYFYKRLHPFIQIQLDHQKRDLDFWEEIVKKVVNVKVKANLQLPFGIKKIDSKCPKYYKLIAKKDKKERNWEY